MKRPQVSHNEIDELLRYVDGELTARAAGRVRAHLEACWQCRAERDKLESTAAQCVNYRKNFLQRYLPSPPAPWMDIYQGFSEIDASMEPGFFHRVRRILEWPVEDARRWAVAAAVLLVLAGVFYKFRQTPSVQAAELLRKAAALADANPAKARHIEIRTKSHRLRRAVGSATNVDAAERDTANSLQAMFVAAHYDWADPLSAKAYQAWRGQLADKHDEVVAEQNKYLIRTETSSGTLAGATLTLSIRDLSPVEERLEFRNQEWVEISALPDEPAPPASAVATSIDRHLAAPLAEPASPTIDATTNGSPATVGDELHVIAALHQLGADMGEPLEVSRSGASVIVSGVGIPSSRQQEISQALGSNPRVVVRFSESAPATVQPRRENPAETAVNADLKELQARIAQQVGGRVNFDQLAGQVLDSSESMISRAYALRRLAERFPSAVEAELNSEDLHLLRQLQQEHVSGMRLQLSEMDHLLRPVLPAVSGRVAPDNQVSSSNAWQPATEDIFQSARQLEKLLAGMFGAAPLEATNEQLPSQSLIILARLRTKLDLYNGLLTKPPERRDR